MGQAGQKNEDDIDHEEEKGELVASIPAVHQFSNEVHHHEIRSSPLKLKINFF